MDECVGAWVSVPQTPNPNATKSTKNTKPTDLFGYPILSMLNTRHLEIRAGTSSSSKLAMCLACSSSAPCSSFSWSSFACFSFAALISLSCFAFAP